MARYNGNQIYLAIDGVVAHAEYKDVQITPSVASVDTTRGSGTTHMLRNEGLRDTKITITIGYETSKIQQQLALLKPGTHTVVFGPEGNAAGKPKHEQSFIFTEAPFSTTVAKAEVAFAITGEGAELPVSDMFNGAVF